MPALSIIIPTRNTSAMTLACCRTVLATVPVAAEVLVVDDASDDDTVERLAGLDARLSIVRRSTPGGFAIAANAGAAAAHGDILLFLNSDTQVAPGSVASLVAALDSDASLGIVGAALLNPDGTPQWSGGPIPSLTWMAAAASGAGGVLRRLRGRRAAAPLCDVGWVSGASMAMRRDVFASVGPFAERYRFYCQDLEICARARDAGWRVGIVGDAHVVHLGGASVGASGLGYRAEWLWPDLAAWASTYRGQSYGRLARHTLHAAAWSRVAARIVRGRGPSDDVTRACLAGARVLSRGACA